MNHITLPIKPDLSQNNFDSYSENTLSKLYYTLKNRLLNVQSYRNQKEYVAVLLSTMKSIKQVLEERRGN